jgi:hypothetical protein
MLRILIVFSIAAWLAGAAGVDAPLLHLSIPKMEKLGSISLGKYSLATSKLRRKKLRRRTTTAA